MTTAGAEARATDAARMRLFFAIWPPEATATALHQWAVATQAVVGGRAIAVANIHVTLAFLGTVPAEQLEAAIAAGRSVADELAERAAPLQLPITEARYWPRSHIVWVGPKETPAPLAALGADLGRALSAAGFAPDSRELIAHVTLLRDVPRLRGLPDLPKVQWPITEFVLVRSVPGAAGSAYTILARFALGYN